MEEDFGARKGLTLLGWSTSPFLSLYLAPLPLPSVSWPPSRTTNNSYNLCIGQFVAFQLTLFGTGLFYGQIYWEHDIILENVFLRDNSKFMALPAPSGNFPINMCSPGVVGLALSYAAPIVSLLGSFLSIFTETEKEMVSVERVLQYMDIPREELHGSQPIETNWTRQEQIEFQNVTLRYMPLLPAALKDVSFTIAGGMQVGIVGRTGAGNSSILNAIFRLNPICQGSILVDGINIYDVPVRYLRSHFAVVP
ncbi:ABC transporter C family member 13-like [Actinidia eriantha]|uniref:ABC transporter C family member 13-like n=1 Tax=Actinidia eriantha TaxID=165200 RepID=UPI00258E1353|nr:ABC transporter C family member 13-like [Actinidia eriantha]